MKLKLCKAREIKHINHSFGWSIKHIKLRLLMYVNNNDNIISKIKAMDKTRYYRVRECI